MTEKNQTPARHPVETIAYRQFRVLIDGLPTGFIVKAETLLEARRQIVIGAGRLDFDPDDIELSEVV